MPRNGGREVWDVPGVSCARRDPPVWPLLSGPALPAVPRPPARGAQEERALSLAHFKAGSRSSSSEEGGHLHGGGTPAVRGPLPRPGLRDSQDGPGEPDCLGSPCAQGSQMLWGGPWTPGVIHLAIGVLCALGTVHLRVPTCPEVLCLLGGTPAPWGLAHLEGSPVPCRPLCPVGVNVPC